VQIVAGLPANTAPNQDNSAYSFDGSGDNQASGAVVIEAIITGVPSADARALNDLVDGTSLGENASGNDLIGRVKYGNPANSNNNSGGGNSANGNANGNGNGQGNGNGNGGNNNGRGNGGVDSGTGNGGNGNSGNSGNSGTPGPSTVTVHIYLTHR
jgi:hypothetical protein